MKLVESELLHGAAYRVCYEILNPDNCLTSARLEEVNETAKKILQWAETQEAKLQDAYRKAACDVVKRAADCLENHERALALIQAFQQIARPTL